MREPPCLTCGLIGTLGILTECGQLATISTSHCKCQFTQRTKHNVLREWEGNPMPVWVWILIGVVFVGGGVVVVWFIRASKDLSRWQAEVLERGEVTAAWIVDVQPKEGLMWPIVLILLCPDPDVPDETMRDIVRRTRAVRKRKPKDPDAAYVARVTGSQSFNPGRTRLPDNFTHGYEVYSCFFDVYPEHEENLPKGSLEGESFSIKLLWDEHETILVVPPKRKSRNRERHWFSTRSPGER